MIKTSLDVIPMYLSNKINFEKKCANSKKETRNTQETQLKRDFSFWLKIESCLQNLNILSQNSACFERKQISH